MDFSFNEEQDAVRDLANQVYGPGGGRSRGGDHADDVSAPRKLEQLVEQPAGIHATPLVHAHGNQGALA